MEDNNKYAAHLPDNFGFPDGAEKFPKMIMMTMSNICNSKCTMCPFTIDNALRKRDEYALMPAPLFRKVIDESVGQNTYLRVTGTGEPFVNPDLVDLLVEAKSKGVKCGVITNGSLLTPDKSKRLIDAGVDSLEMSVDASDEKTYSEIRVGLSFKKLIKNIDFMIQYRNKVKSSTRILVSAVENLEKINPLEVKEFWNSKNVDNVIIRKFLTYGTLPKEVYSDITYLPKDQRVPCPYPFERMVVLASGEVTFCNYDVRDNHYFGNVNSISIKDIWRSEKFDLWRSRILKGEYEELPLCKKCDDWKYKSWKHNFFKVMDNAKTKEPGEE